MRELAQLAADGYAHRRQLLDAGLDDGEIRRFIRSGEIVRIRRGSYAPGAQETAVRAFRRRVRAIAARSPEYVVAGPSAAAVYGAPLWKADLSEVTLIRPSASGGSHTAGRRVRAALLEPAEVLEYDGLRVTSPARTVQDMGCWCSVETAVVAGDHLGRAFPGRLSWPDGLRARRIGIRQARAVHAALDPRSESPGETLTRLLLVGAGLPVPEAQVEVFDPDGTFLGRCDLGWPEHGAVLEFDGRVKYEPTAAGRTASETLFLEKVREDGLRACGIAVVRVVWSDLSTPTVMRDRVQRALVLGEKSVKAGLVVARFRLTPRL